MNKILILILILFFSCDENVIIVNSNYNKVKINKVEILEFNNSNSVGNNWDDESYPDIYLVYREEGQPLFTSSIIIEVEESNLPLDIYFDMIISSNYFYRELEIFVYDNDQLSEDDLVGRTNNFKFADAITNNIYENIITIDNNGLKLNIHLSWEE